jgi:Chromo (CHRromatin Organisation MOdifier) domain
VRKKIKKPKKPKAEAAPEGEPPAADSDGEYEVESIVSHKKEKGKTLYRVKWKGYPSSQDSWLPGAELSCRDLLKKYKNKQKKESKDVYTVSQTRVKIRLQLDIFCDFIRLKKSSIIVA